MLCFLGYLVLGSNSLRAASVYDTCWNPPNVTIDSAHPYYFPLWLPSWDLDKINITKATLKVTYLNQDMLDIRMFAADPATDTGSATSYNILLGTVPWKGYTASGTKEFDLLASLNKGTVKSLFDGQSILYLVADCHYVFDKASVHLEGNAVPIPPAFILLGSGILGLLGFRRSMNQFRV
jgi:hypothetical protein